MPVYENGSLLGGGGGGGGGGEPARLMEITGFSAANHFASANGAVAGSGTMTHVSVYRVRRGAQTSSMFVAGQAAFYSSGFAHCVTGNQPKHFLYDGLGALRENFGGRWLGTSGGHNGPDNANGVLVHQVSTWDGTNFLIYLQGALFASQGGGGGGITDSPAPYAVGYTAANGGYGAFDGGWAGGGVHTGLVATPDQIFAHYLACRDNLGMVDDGLGFTHLWSLNGLSAGAPPASIEDTGTAASATLNRVGAPVVAARYPVWFQGGGGY